MLLNSFLPITHSYQTRYKVTVLNRLLQLIPMLNTVWCLPFKTLKWCLPLMRCPIQPLCLLWWTPWCMATSIRKWTTWISKLALSTLGCIKLTSSGIRSIRWCLNQKITIKATINTMATAKITSIIKNNPEKKGQWCNNKSLKSRSKRCLLIFLKTAKTKTALEWFNPSLILRVSKKKIWFLRLSSRRYPT